MNVKKIIDLCKKNSFLRLYDGEGVQWVSDGRALFPLFNLPIFDEDSICATFDITEKKAAKMHISRNNSFPVGFDFSDDVPKEEQCTRGDPLFGGIVPLTTSHGMMFIDGRYLLPFSDADDDMLFIYERTADNGQTYFAIKQGFVLVGIVMPFDCVNENFVKRFKTIYEQCEITLYNQELKKEAAERCE